MCCVALAFDRSPSFAVNKPAGAPCENLDAAGRCTIHENLDQRGYKGCVAYDCLGAGQRITQDIFGGRHWLEDRRLLEPMSRAFAVMRRIHGMLELLAAAEALPLDTGERARLAGLAAKLEPRQGWSEASLKAAPISQIGAEVNAFLQSLRRHASAR